MKKVLAMMLLVVMVFSCCSLAWADNLQSFAVQTVRVDEKGGLNVVVFYPQEGQLQAKDFSVTLDQSAVKVESISSLKSSDVGTTWLFVVDVSVVRVDKAQAILTGLLLGDGSVLGTGDQAGIFATGKSEKDIQLTNNRQLLKSQIDGLKREPNSKQLFAQIAAALNFLNTGKEVRERKVLVVISNGVNENETGMSYDELTKRLENTKTTVYTFALLSAERNAKKVERYNAFARSGLGGQFYEITQNAAADSKVQDLIRNENLFRCLNTNPGEEGLKGKTVTVSRADNSKVTDSIDLTDEEQALIGKAADAAIAALETPTPTPEPETESKPVVTEPPKDESGLSPIQLGIIAAAAVLVVLIIVLISRKGKKKQVDDSPAPASSPSLYDDMESKTEAAPPTPSASSLMVKLESVGLDEPKSYSSPMVDELVIGRVPQKARLIVPDPKVSGANSKLTYVNRVMYLEDLGSTNGTQLNGMKVTGKVVVHQQDTIHIGQSNLRISWEKVQ